MDFVKADSEISRSTVLSMSRTTRDLTTWRVQSYEFYAMTTDCPEREMLNYFEVTHQ